MQDRQENEEITVSYDLFIKVNNWHGEHPGEPLILTADEVCDLAGCCRWLYRRAEED